MTKQKVLLGRDLAPGMMPQLAEYIGAWAKYLRDVEGLPVKYISPFNESENKSDGRKTGVTRSRTMRPTTTSTGRTRRCS